MQDCPKCHAALPLNFAGTECPTCGVIFAKYYAADAKRREAESIRAAAAAARQSVPVPTPTTLPPAPAIETTNCPACGGLVAYGAKSCPHCGKSKPAPSPPRPPTKVTKTHLALAALLLIAILMSVGNQPEPLTGDQVARICATEVGIDPNSSRALTMQDLRAIDACINRYGFKTKP